MVRRRRGSTGLSQDLRDFILFFGGFAGVAYEAIFTKADRPYLLVVFAAMMGLPTFLDQRPGGPKEKRLEKSLMDHFTRNEDDDPPGRYQDDSEDFDDQDEDDDRYDDRRRERGREPPPRRRPRDDDDYDRPRYRDDPRDGRRRR